MVAGERERWQGLSENRDHTEGTVDVSHAEKVADKHQHTQPREPTLTKTQKGNCRRRQMESLIHSQMVRCTYVPMREAEEGGGWVKESQRGDKRESTPSRRPLTIVPHKISS